MTKAINAILLSAGEGRRMASRVQKTMHPMCGWPLLGWVMRSIQSSVTRRPVIVTGFDEGNVREYFGQDAAYARQQRLGSTAEAARTGLGAIQDGDGYVLVLYGSMPLLSQNSVAAMVDAARGGAASRLVCLSEDGGARPVPAYCFELDALRHSLEDDADEMEDCILSLRDRGLPVIDVYAPEYEGIVVENRADLWACSKLMQNRINTRHMLNGVTFIDPASAYVDAGVRIGVDTVIYPDVYLSGDTAIGENCTIYNGCRLTDTVVANGCTLQAVVAEEARVAEGARIGPFVRLRPNASVGQGCKVGNFVEIKNSTIGAKTSIAHLTYVGDADVGSRVNMGCGTVFVNYDGYKKHRSTVGDDVFLGCQTALVSPVNVGDRAYTAAGTVLTGDVPADAMAISRGRQQNKEGWAARYRELKGPKK